MLEDDALLGHFKLDGSPYDGSFEDSVRAWARDFEDFRGRVVRQEMLWNGLWVSTVWIGINLAPFRIGLDRPLIFETMVFDHLNAGSTVDEACERYATLEDAELGHRFLTEEYSRVLPTLIRWFRAGFAETDRYEWAEED